MKESKGWVRRRAGFAQPARSAGTAQCAAKPLPHPYDTALGTIALGLLLTVALVVVLRHLGG